MKRFEAHKARRKDSLVRGPNTRTNPKLIPQYRTTVVERLLLMGAVGILPWQFYLPLVGGVSIAFIIFGILGAYLILWRPRILSRVIFHPVFLAGYAFVGTGLIMELAHGDPGYTDLFRILLMIVGAVLVAALCRDRSAFLFAMFGLVLSSLLMSTLLIFHTYGALGSAKSNDFQDATQFRERLYYDNPMEATDENTMGFFAAQGTVVAMVLFLTIRAGYLRYIFLLMGTFCLLGSFLPMSRGAIVILCLSSVAAYYAYGILRPKVLIAVGIAGLITLIWVPDVIFSRLDFSLEGKHSGPHHVEGRSRLYSAVIEHFPEYFLTGVGIEQFYGKWGLRHGFSRKVWYYSVVIDKVYGTHNTFSQILVYWGLPGLLALLVLLWQAYLCLPTRRSADPVYLCLVGISVSVLLESLFIHTFYGKEFSLALGLLAGCSLWIWEKRSSRRLAQDRKKATPDSPKWKNGVPLNVVHH